jgi:hypothetical protein
VTHIFSLLPTFQSSTTFYFLYSTVFIVSKINLYRGSKMATRRKKHIACAPFLFVCFLLFFFYSYVHTMFELFLPLLPLPLRVLLKVKSLLSCWRHTWQENPPRRGKLWHLWTPSLHIASPYHLIWRNQEGFHTARCWLLTCLGDADQQVSK